MFVQIMTIKSQLGRLFWLLCVAFDNITLHNNLHWITFITLHCPCALECHCFYPIEYHCISPMSLHCTSLHYIAANCTRWVQEAPPPVTSDLLPTAPIHQLLLLMIFVVVVVVDYIIDLFVIINVVDELSRPSMHKLASLMLRLRLVLVLLSLLMFIVMSNSEVFCCGIPRYFLKWNPDLP